MGMMVCGCHGYDGCHGNNGLLLSWEWFMVVMGMMVCGCHGNDGLWLSWGYNSECLLLGGRKGDNYYLGNYLLYWYGLYYQMWVTCVFTTFTTVVCE